MTRGGVYATRPIDEAARLAVVAARKAFDNDPNVARK